MNNDTLHHVIRWNVTAPTVFTGRDVAVGFP
jgi:hypothetical protein